MKRPPLCHRRMQSARKAADARLRALPNVVGTCFGFKSTGGKRSEQLCVTVFVRRKVKPGRLKPEHHVPEEVRRHGMDLPTDVVAIGRIRNQGGFAIHAAGQKGTIGAWGLNDASAFGITCAHCLAPAGGIVTGEFPVPGSYLALGPSDASTNLPGTGLYPSYGDIDAGLIRLTTSSVQDYASSRPPQPVYRPLGSVDANHLKVLLRQLPVQGWGAGSGRLLRGVVTGVLVDLSPLHFDLMIEDPDGGGLTVLGDSGLVWATLIGQALALHQAGDEENDGSPSKHAFGCFAFRIADAFGLGFRQA